MQFVLFYFKWKKISRALTEYLNSSCNVLVKLNKKLEFSGHVFFESISLDKIKAALLYLNNNNSFCKDIRKNVDSINDDLLRVKEEYYIEMILKLKWRPK